MNNANNNFLDRLENLNAIGVALPRKKTPPGSLEAILLAAKSLTNADGSTLYRVTDDNRLKFEILRIHWLVFANVT